MPRYIDADVLCRETEKMIAESHEARMAVVDDEFLDLINDAYVEEDVVEVVRCKDCDVPHNKWTGCPNLNGLIPPPDFYCARGERRHTRVDVPDISVGDKPSCKVCERITEANKDIFWVFARTHQPGTREEFLQIPYEDTRFCPVCGREIEKLREVTQEEYARCVKGEWERKENRT
jgi:hypothetical protein